MLILLPCGKSLPQAMNFQIQQKAKQAYAIGINLFYDKTRVANKNNSIYGAAMNSYKAKFKTLVH